MEHFAEIAVRVAEYIHCSEQIVQCIEFVVDIHIVVILAVASTAVVQVLVAVPIAVAVDMVAADIQSWFLIVGDIQYEAVADLEWVVGNKLVVLEMVVGAALVDHSRYFFLSSNTYAKEIAQRSIIIKKSAEA